MFQTSFAFSLTIYYMRAHLSHLNQRAFGQTLLLIEMPPRPQVIMLKTLSGSKFELSTPVMHIGNTDPSPAYVYKEPVRTLV